MLIRSVKPKDVDVIVDIWNEAIRNSIATFTDQEKSNRDLLDMIAENQDSNRGFYIAEEKGTALGFTTYGLFRGGPGYIYTAEHSIYLRPDARGKGIGKALMKTLMAQARDAGLHSLIGGLSGENIGAIKFHKALGFAKVAEVKQAGYKFDRWLDLVLMQKLL